MEDGKRKEKGRKQNIQRKLIGLFQINGQVKTFFNSRVGEVIAKAAKELNAGLIVVSSRGHGSVRRAVLGSICDYLLKEASCPVAVHKHKNKSK